MIWGLILVILGILFLGINMNFIEPELFARIFEFWPLLLVILGVHLFLKKYKLGPLVTLLLIALFGGLVVWSGYFQRPIIKRDVAVKDNNFSQDLGQNVKNGAVKVTTGAIKFTVSGSTEKLVEGVLSSNFMSPRLTEFNSADSQKVTISTEGETPRIWWSGLKNEMTMRLSNKVPVDFEVDSGASEMDFDFSEVTLNSFLIKSGASSIDLKVGDKISAQTRGEFNVGASDIKIRIPKGIGARIKADTGITGKSFEGFTQKGDYYENAEYATAQKKLELLIKAGASNISVRSY